MKKYVVEKIDQTLLKKIADEIQAFYKACQGRGVTVAQKKKGGIRTMAEGREGYARLISKIAEQNNESLNKWTISRN